MNTFFTLALITILPYTAFGFGCEIATTNTNCNRLTKCKWESNQCTGTYQPTCTSKNCLFVYPRGSTSTGNAAGDQTDPFKSFDEALGKTGNGASDIFIVSDDIEPNPIIKVLNVSTITSKVMRVKPLFANTYFTLDFSPVFGEIAAIQSNPNPSPCAIKTTNSVTHLYMDYGYVIGKAKSVGATCFCFAKKNYFVRFQYFRIIDQTDLQYPVKLVNQTEGRFIIKYSIFENMNYQIHYTTTSTTTQTFFRNEYRNIRFNEPLFKLYGMFRIINQYTKIDNISSTSLTGYMYSIEGLPEANTFFQFKQVEVNNVSSLFLDGITMKTISIIDSKFYNFNYTLPSQYPLFRIKGLGIQDSVLNTARNEFQNFTVRHSFAQVDFVKQTNNLDLYNNFKRTRLRPSEMQSYDIGQIKQNRGLVFVMTSCEYICKYTNFTNIDYSALHLKLSNINFDYLEFSNQQIIEQDPNYWKKFNDKDDGVTWLIMENANTINTRSNVDYCNFGPNGGNPKIGGGISFVSQFEAVIIIKKSNFIGLSAQSGAGLYMQFSLAEIQFHNLLFANGTASLNGGGIHLTNYGKNTEEEVKNYVKFVNTDFKNNSAGRNGGGVYIESSNLDFVNVDFLNNSAESGGGLYMMSHGSNPYFHLRAAETFQTRFRNINFIGNNATLLGPAIKAYFDIFKVMNVETKEELANFKENRLLLKDGAKSRSWSLDEVSLDKPSVFRIRFYNLSTITEVDTSSNLKEIVENSTIASLDREVFTKQVNKDIELQIKSGHSLPQVIQIDVLDEKHQIIPLISEDEIIEFKLIPVGDVSMVKHTKFSSFPEKFNKGSVFLKEQFNFVGESQSDALLTFKSKPSEASILQDSKLSVDFIFKVHFRKCDVGDVYNKISKTCNTCPQNTFSIVDPYDENAACSPCPQNGICLGGSNVPPKAGYFRTSSESVNFMKCEVESSCKGGLIDGQYFAEGKCEEPYSGNGCSQCGDQAAKFGGYGKCYKCQEDTSYYLKFAAFLIVQMVVISLAASTSLKLNDINRESAQILDSRATIDLTPSAYSSSFVVIKIAMNYFLLQGMIHYMKLEWPGSVNEIFNIVTNFLPTMEQGFSVDCFIVLSTSNQSVITVSRLVITILKPVALFLLFALIIFMKSLISKAKKLLSRKKLAVSSQSSLQISPTNSSSDSQTMKEVLLIVAIALAYFHQTEIVFLLLKMFKCVNLGTHEDPQYYLEANLQIRCYENEHLHWALGYSLPIIFIFSIITPIYIYRKLKKAPKARKQQSLACQFFTYGLKEDYFHWEVVVMVRKIILAFVIILMPAEYKAVGCLFQIILISIFGYFHVRANPYKNSKFNKIEMLSLVSCFIMMSGGLVLETQNKENDFYFTYLLSYGALVINLALLVIFLSYPFQEFKKFAQRRGWISFAKTQFAKLRRNKINKEVKW